VGGVMREIDSARRWHERQLAKSSET